MKIPIDLKTGNVIQDDNKDVIVGIDLGTTNSLIAYIYEGQPLTIKSTCDQNPLTPSVLHFSDDGAIIVGPEAKKYLISDPQNTVFSVKRLMGKSYSDISTIKSNIGYEIIDEGADALVKIKVKNKYYTPLELSAEILKSLKNDAEGHLKRIVSKAVITVPAYFNDAQRQATRDAGKLAGLDVLRIINEPTAASLAYGIGLSRDTVSNIAVYDLGGGTFDISILHLEDGVFDVLSTHGDTFLGGDDIDMAILEYWKQNRLLYEISVQELRLAAEEAKIFLSRNDFFRKTIGGIALEIDKVTFENLLVPFVERTMESVRFAVKDSGLSTQEIDNVILVGGSSRIPFIKKVLADFFGKIPDDTINPDEVVALGAALQGDILAGNRKDILLLDVTPLSLGIETVGGLMDTIITRNSKVPARAGRQYTTSVDGQTNLRISIYQGERDLVQHNRKLGEFVLKNIPPMVAGLPKIDVHFIIDADGILVVKAKELRSDIEASIDIRSTYGISEEQMALMLLDSIKNAEADVQKRAVLEAINEANNILHATEKFISQNEEILSVSEIKELSEYAAKISSAIATEDKDKIHTAIKLLNDYSIPLAHRSLDTNIAKSLKGLKV